MVCPPIWRTPTSKETRVRVEGFSKISATMRPAAAASSSGAPLGRPARAVFIARGLVDHGAQVGGVGLVDVEEMVHGIGLSAGGRRRGRLPPAPPGGIFIKKDEGAGGRARSSAAAAVEAGDRLGDLVLGDGQRGQEAHDVVGRRHGEQPARRSRPCTTSVLGTLHFRPSIRPAPRTLEDLGWAATSPSSFWRRRPPCGSPRPGSRVGDVSITAQPTAQPSGLPP
jgi:hypothetical protein